MSQKDYTFNEHYLICYNSGAVNVPSTGTCRVTFNDRTKSLVFLAGTTIVLEDVRSINMDTADYANMSFVEVDDYRDFFPKSI